MATPRPAVSRIAPLTEGELTDDQRALLATVAVDVNQAQHIFSTLARHPKLTKAWMRFGGRLLAGELPARDRELLVLRTGWRCQSVYEWGQHVAIGRRAGITEDEFVRIAAGPDAPGWSAWDALLLRAADELHDDACLCDATWAALAERYDEHQMIEVPMLVGQYHLVSFTLNSLGVQREEGVDGFPEPV